MEHLKVSSRRSGHDGWHISCSCGRSWTGWRWLIEEQYDDHIPLDDLPTPPVYPVSAEHKSERAAEDAWLREAEAGDGASRTNGGDGW